MTPDTLSLTAAIETIQASIDAQCKARDQMIALLPTTKRPARLKEVCGMEIKKGGGVRRRKQA